MPILKKILLLLFIIFIAVQFIRPEKNQAAPPFPNDIATLYPVSDSVRKILQKACNDCHSSNTTYPWYNNIQPVASWLHNHVEEGKREVNFNEFATYRIGKQYRKLLEVKEQIEKDEMPLSSYTLIHTNAKLSEQEKHILVAWAENLRVIIRNKYPADSLVAKRR